MNLVFFFSQFQLLIFDLLKIKLCIFFYFLFIKLIYLHDLSRRFNRLAQVDLDYFFRSFFN